MKNFLFFFFFKFANLEFLYFSFAIGGDGYVYEARGFNVKGEFATPTYNENSIGIDFIGNWSGMKIINITFN